MHDNKHSYKYLIYAKMNWVLRNKDENCELTTRRQSFKKIKERIGKQQQKIMWIIFNPCTHMCI